MSGPPSRVHHALETAAGRLLLARGAPEIWAEVVDGRSRPSNRDRKVWSEAPFLLLGPDGDRPMAEVAVPVVDGGGQPRAALCARGDPSAFPDDVLKNDVAPHLVRAARAAGRAMADA